MRALVIISGIALFVGVPSLWISYELHAHLPDSIERVLFAVMLGAYVFTYSAKGLVVLLMALTNRRLEK